MKLFRMTSQKSEVFDYARCTHLGTWIEKKCDACGAYLGSELVEPVVLEWEKGSLVLGDVTNAGSCFLVNTKARKFFEKKSSFTKFVNPLYVKSKMKRGVVNVDNLPPLWVMMNSHYVKLDVKSSGLVESERSCAKKVHYVFKNEGLVVKKSSVKNSQLFYIKEFGCSSVFFCTEELVEDAISEGMTNLRFIEAGEII